MRSAIVAAALAAGAIAVPHNKRQNVVVTDVDIVYYTDIVTVTAGSEPSSTAVASSSINTQAHWGHSHTWHYSQPASSASSVESSAAPSSTYVAPSSSAAPTTPSSTYVAPAPSSTSVWSSSPVASSSAAPASSAASSSSSAAPTDYAGKAVLHHNIHRGNHSAPDIAWDDNLASIAGDIAATCIYEHNTTAGGGGYGQNIAAGVEPDNITAIITDLFYNGEVGWYADLYGQAQPDMTNFEHWGHFSQIVWKATTKVGCATQDCSAGGLANVGSDVAPYFTVCNYENPGNYENEYGDNVGSPLGQATAQWNQGL